MKKLLPLFLILSTVQLFATATASGKLQQPSGVGATPGYVLFELENCGGNYPTVAGASITPTQKFTLASDGSWSGQLYRNDEISCNGANSTWWHKTYHVNATQVGPAVDYLCSQNVCVFDGSGGLTPITVYPPPTPPVQPLTGAESVVCSFASAQSTWTCIENMGTQQVVAQFFNSSSQEIFPDTATATDVNTFTATFLQPQAGFMRVVNVGNWTPSTTFPNYIIGNPTSSQSIAGDHPFTIAGSLSALRIGGVRYADQFSGADMGAQINNAYLDCPTSGCMIVVPQKSDGSCYSFATPVNLAINNKLATLAGQGSGSTCLTYTGTGTAITWQWGGQHLPQTALSGIHLACASSSATGIQIGTLATFTDQVTLDNGAVTGCGTGLTAVGGEAFDITLKNFSIFNNVDGVTAPNGIVALYLQNSAIFQNSDCGLSFATGPTSVTIFGGDIESNGTSTTTGGVCMTGNGVALSTYGVHWENSIPASEGVFVYSTGSGSSINIHGGDMKVDAQAATTVPAVINFDGSDTLNVDGTSLSLGAGITLTSAILSGSNTCTIYTRFRFGQAPGSVIGTTGTGPCNNIHREDSPGAGANAIQPFVLKNWYLDFIEGNACVAGTAIHNELCADPVSGRFKMSNNGGALVQVVGSGADINTSDQVTVTHLAAALPILQGGTASTTATGSGSVVLATSPTVSGETHTLLTNGTGLEILNTTTTCTTGTVAGNNCTTSSISLPVAFADTSYRIVCTLDGISGSPLGPFITKGTSNFTITIQTALAVASSYTSADCIASHN